MTNQQIDAQAIYTCHTHGTCDLPIEKVTGKLIDGQWWWVCRPEFSCTPVRDMDFRAADKLHAILLGYAPTGKEQAFCTAMLNLMRAEGCDDLYIERAIAQVLSDGLHHGNWPWIQPWVTEIGIEAATAQLHERTAASQA